ncbi:AAA family ATPase [Nostoc sp.]|uniref:AAA family ATPase n=1 Tax=Nostoc sp. TaxID=1180 RepID=UPI002FFA1258
MKVKRLQMQFFRGIGNLTLDFHQTEPTILIGINGVGKSSVLDCITILLSRFTSPIQSSTASGRIFTKEDVTNRRLITRNEITISVDSQEVIWSLTKWKQRSGKYAGSSLMDLRKLLEKVQQELRSNPKLNLTVIIYYDVNRAVLDIPLRIRRKKYSSEQIHAYDQALTGGKIDFRFFFEWFRNQEDLENESLRDNPNDRDKLLETVRKAIYLLLPEFSNLRVRRSPLRMTVKKQGQELIINQLSDGEKCLLAMVGDLARRLAIANPGLPDPLQGDGVVLIDEIELHLHPKWQREIIPALTRTFPNCQFIVTTHSPQVISQVKPEGIYILEKTDEGVVAKRPESSFGRDSNRILEDLMDVPARPQEIKESLLELFRLIDAGNLEGARQLRQQLANEIGADEPEFVKADVLIRRKEIINR